MTGQPTAGLWRESKDILRWLNEVTGCDYSAVEECNTGVALALLLAGYYPKLVPLSQIHFNPNTKEQSFANWDVVDRSVRALGVNETPFDIYKAVAKDTMANLNALRFLQNLLEMLGQDDVQPASPGSPMYRNIATPANSLHTTPDRSPSRQRPLYYPTAPEYDSSDEGIRDGVMTHNAVVQRGSNIKVCVRARPPLNAEPNAEGTYLYKEGNTWHFPNSRTISWDDGETGQIEYEFHNVFNPTHNTADVYKAMAKNAVEDILQGVNATILAYGQTNSGKTYTIEGTKTSRGIITYAAKDLFELIQRNESEDYQPTLSMSYMEIYNESAYDLLSKNNSKELPLRDGTGGTHVDGLAEESVTSAQQLLDIYSRAAAKRHVGKNNAHEAASRSHAILQIRVQSRDRYITKGTATLNIVDLAGSETSYQPFKSKGDGNYDPFDRDEIKFGPQSARLVQTKKEFGKRTKEGASIRKGLLALVRVINGLAIGTEFLPYRDSRLTRILSNSLTDTSNIILICTINPEERRETQNTLHFASVAQSIQPPPAKEGRPKSDTEAYKQEIDKLRTELKKTQSQLWRANSENDLLKTESMKDMNRDRSMDEVGNSPFGGSLSSSSTPNDKGKEIVYEKVVDEEMIARVTELENDNHQLKARADEVERELKETKRKLEEAEDRVHDDDSRVRDLEDAVQEKDAELKDLWDKSMNTQSQNTKDKDELRDKYLKQRSRTEDLEQALNRKERELTEAKNGARRADQLVEQLRTVNDANRDLQIQLYNMKRERNAMQKYIAEEQKKNQKKGSKICLPSRSKKKTSSLGDTSDQPWEQYLEGPARAPAEPGAQGRATRTRPPPDNSTGNSGNDENNRSVHF